MSHKSFQGKTVVIVAAAGSGTRLGLGYNKLFARAGGKTMLEHTLDKFGNYPIVVPVSEEDAQAVRAILSARDNVYIIAGGDSRTATVKAALDFISDCQTVLIHDGARPNVSGALIRRIEQAAAKAGAAVPYVAVTDTLKRISATGTAEPIEREGAMSIQTPQGFDYARLMRAYGDVANRSYTDDSAVWESGGGTVEYIEGETGNYKITYMSDLIRWERGFDGGACNIRVGQGYDIHRLVAGRKLILCGVEIDSPLGLDGHSDADVAVHALMDAMLSAAGCKDIGTYFPDTDMRFKGADSMALLSQVVGIVADKGCSVNNISLVIIAERPKLKGHIDRMIDNISKCVGLDTGLIGITASTNERIGAVGRQEGIAALCTVVLAHQLKS